VSDRGRCSVPPRLHGVELPVALFDAAGFPSRYRCFSATTSSYSSGSAGSLASSCATKGAHDCSRRRYDGAGSYPAVRGGPSAGRSALGRSADNAVCRFRTGLPRMPPAVLGPVCRRCRPPSLGRSADNAVCCFRTGLPTMPPAVLGPVCRRCRPPSLGRSADNAAPSWAGLPTMPPAIFSARSDRPRPRMPSSPRSDRPRSRIPSYQADLTGPRLPYPAPWYNYSASYFGGFGE
jgi:hypothetical protein